MIDIDSITQVTPKLYLGTWGDASNLMYDNPNNITAVLSLCQDSVELPSTIRHIVIPFMDGHNILDRVIDECVSTIFESMRRGETLLVHCNMGASRSPAIVAAYLFQTRRLGSPELTLEDVLDELHQMRPVVNPSPAVVHSIKKHLQIWPYDGSFKQGE